MNLNHVGKSYTSNSMESLAKRLKALRDRKGLSQKDVADRLGIAASTYRDWEYGKQIKGEPYVALSEAFQVSLTELLTGKRDLIPTSILSELNDLERIVESIRKNVAAL